MSMTIEWWIGRMMTILRCNAGKSEQVLGLEVFFAKKCLLEKIERKQEKTNNNVEHIWKCKEVRNEGKGERESEEGGSRTSGHARVVR
jgi:hypothetical protein